MACYKVGSPDRPAYIRGRTGAKKYGSKEDCDAECDGAGTGACNPVNGIGACVEVKPCQCYGLFLGIGTKCNPLP